MNKSKKQIVKVDLPEVRKPFFEAGDKLHMLFEASPAELKPKVKKIIDEHFKLYQELNEKYNWD